MRTSAKTGMNVDESFLEMTKKLIVKKNASGTDDKKTAGLRKLKEQMESGSEKEGCC